jgi:hypothetical protein
VLSTEQPLIGGSGAFQPIGSSHHGKLKALLGIASNVETRHWCRSRFVAFGLIVFSERATRKLPEIVVLDLGGNNEQGRAFNQCAVLKLRTGKLAVTVAETCNRGFVYAHSHRIEKKTRPSAGDRTGHEEHHAFTPQAKLDCQCSGVLARAKRAEPTARVLPAISIGARENAFAVALAQTFNFRQRGTTISPGPPLPRSSM